MVNLLELLPWILITGIVPLVMLFLPYMKKKISERDLHLMLGASAGILLGISIYAASLLSKLKIIDYETEERTQDIIMEESLFSYFSIITNPTLQTFGF